MPPTERHREHNLGVLISNLGTPDSYRVKDVKKFLKSFLSDPRVVNVPRPIWWFVLNVIILNTRPRKTAAAYEKIWSEQGSPLLTLSRSLTSRIHHALRNNANIVGVELGMRYGMPSIENAIERLHAAGAKQLLIVPLYPQFSYTTTASTQDEVERVVNNSNQLYLAKLINSYYDQPDYIEALANSVRRYWDGHGEAEKLIISFHGIPLDYVDSGDPYQRQCQITADLLAAQLELAPDRWNISYQSRLGPKKWLEPYTDQTLVKLAQRGTKSVQIICPGFSVDCLETLEEIAIANRDTYIQAGGRKYQYIPCLNDSIEHAQMISEIIKTEIK